MHRNHRRYMLDESARREAGKRGRAFAEEHYSEERILAQWDNLFTSVLSRRPVDPMKQAMTESRSQIVAAYNMLKTG